MKFQEGKHRKTFPRSRRHKAELNSEVDHLLDKHSLTKRLKTQSWPDQQNTLQHTALLFSMICLFDIRIIMKRYIERERERDPSIYQSLFKVLGYSGKHNRHG